MIPRLAAIALAIAAGSCATALAPAVVAPMTVAYVEQHIRELHGQTVRMRGEMNNCTSLTCSICDGQREEDACLGISLHADSDDARYLVEELYRFATITIDARIDGSCELGYDPDMPPSNDPDRDVVVVCTDRASSVEDARVIRVDARKPATDGRFDMYEGEPLTVAPSEELDAVLRLGKDGGWFYEEDQDRNLWRLFADPEPLTDGASFILCRCAEDDCTDRWPAMSGRATTRSPANPYYCQYVSRIGEAWVFSP